MATLDRTDARARSGSAEDADYRTTSFWHDSAPGSLDRRAPLPGDVQADVAIVGAGFTGLWTAFYLTEIDPALRIVMVESEIAGYGASGRNGGWCYGGLPGSRHRLVDRYGHDAVMRYERACFETIDVVGDALERVGIDAHYHKGGWSTLAVTQVGLQHARAAVDAHHAFGHTDADYRLLSAEETRARTNVPGALGTVFCPHAARIHPARLARGLADVVERRGVGIYEGTRATLIEPGRVTTDRGTVHADIVIRATEGFTPELKGHKRDLMPFASCMVATEPLPPEAWAEIGWEGREVLSDGRRLFIYAQRTADDRIALGGRGHPYIFGSRLETDFHDLPVHRRLKGVIDKLFPAARDYGITHTWGGVLGIPRDFNASVGLDRRTGLGWAGGYVGDGVAVTNLAGRTLADLVTGRDTDITSLPWVNHRSRKWEPEPLRWIASNGSLKLLRIAERAEETGTRTTFSGRIVDWLSGH
jgi:glycine/D-amino acid oxidase-like deaminating enzyme